MRPIKDATRRVKTPDEVDCPKCGARVGTEVLRGRVRWVTTTTIHIKKDTPSTVCYTVLKIEEHRDRTA